MGAKTLDDRGGGMTGGQRNDHALAAPAADLCGADDGVGRVVASLHDHVGAERPDELQRRILVEHGHGIDGLEGGEHIRAVGLTAHGALGALETPHARIAVDADDERVATLARAAKYVDVAGMQQIEDAVREDDASALLLTPACGSGPVEDLAGRVEGAQKELSTRGWK